MMRHFETRSEEYLVLASHVPMYDLTLRGDAHAPYGTGRFMASSEHDNRS